LPSHVQRSTSLRLTALPSRICLHPAFTQPSPSLHSAVTQPSPSLHSVTQSLQATARLICTCARCPPFPISSRPLAAAARFEQTTSCAIPDLSLPFSCPSPFSVAFALTLHRRLGERTTSDGRTSLELLPVRECTKCGLH
jgi:hypothetical protein